MSNKLIVKDPFEMPAVDDTTVLVLRECADLVPHCWIWNESVGYLEVVTYSGYDIYVTVKNVGMKENATSGTIFPSCMEFLITAPNATPIIDNTVTCLRADFKCPTVGQEALMSVDSTSAIRVGDIIIVDTRYQYLVTEIINEHTMKVLNEEKGKESGVIDVKCNECVPVKILESTHCCEALQDQVDDIYSRIDTKKSIIPDADSLISITNGSNSLTDANNDVVLDVDTDLSKYDNTVSQFITLGDVPRGTLSSSTSVLTVTDGTNNVLDNISLSLDTDLSKYDNTTSAFITLGDVPALPSDTDLSHYDNSTSGFITSSSLPTVNDAQLTIYESDGVTPFVEFTANAASNVTATLPSSGSSYTATAPISIDANNDISISQANATTDGYLSSTDWNTFNNKFGGLVYFKESLSGTVGIFEPVSGTATDFDLGSSVNDYTTAYIRNIRKAGSVISLPSDGGNIVINCGTNGTYGTNYGDIYFRVGYGNKLQIGPGNSTFSTTLTTQNIYPDATANNRNIGNSTSYFNEGWINYIKTNEIKPVSGTNTLIRTNLIPDDLTYKLGDYSTNKFFNSAAISDIYCRNITPGHGNATVTITDPRINVIHPHTGATDVTLDANLRPNGNNQRYIGAFDANFLEGYFYRLYINALYPIAGQAYTIFNTNIRDSSDNQHTIGATNSFAAMRAHAFTNTSDIRLKKNVIEYKDSALDKINNLHPITYNTTTGDDTELKLGLSAQELQEQEPLCVSSGEEQDTKSGDSFLGVNLYSLITLCLKGIKELSAEVKELKVKLGEKDADSKVLEK